MVKLAVERRQFHKRQARRLLGSRSRAHTALALVLVLGLGVLLWWLHPAGVATYPMASTPKEVVSLASASAVVDGGTPQLPLWPGDMPRNLPMEAAVPSDAALSDGKVVPADFSGAYLLNVAVVGGGANALRGLAVVEILLLAGLAGALATEISGRRSAGFLAGILVCSSPAVLSATTTVAMHDALAAGFLVAAVLAAIRFRSSGWFIGVGVCLGMSVLLRYPNVLLIPVATYFVHRYRTEPLKLREMVVSWSAVAATVVIVAIPVHFWMYGDPLSIGTLLRLDLVERIGQGAEAESSVVGRAWRYVTLYAIPSGWAAISLLGLAGLFDGRGERRRAVGARAMLPAFAMIGVALFLMLSLGPNTYGIDGFRVNASVLRYALPLQVLMSIAAAVWLRTRAMRLFTVLTVILVPGLLVIGLFGEGGLVDQRNSRELGRQAIERATHEFAFSSQTFVSRIDSLFWPMFHALNPSHLGAGYPRDFGDSELPHFYEGVAAPGVLAERMVTVVESGRSLALVEDFSWPDGDYMAALKEELRLRGYVSGEPVELGPGFRAHEISRMTLRDMELRGPMAPLERPRP